MRSLQTKLVSGLMLSLIAVFTVLWFLINFSIQSLAEEYIASRLRHDAETLLGTIQFDKAGQLKLNQSSIDPIYNKPYSGHYFRISTANQIINSRSLWDQQLPLAAVVKAGEVKRHYEDGPDNQALLVISNGFIKHKRQLTISVAEDLNPVKSDIEQFQRRFAITAVALLLLLVILQVFILRYSLTPLARLRAELRSLQQGETRQLSTDTPTELQPLVNEINHLLKLMDQRLRRSRDALGDLAHAIKKPLTVMRQLTDKNKNKLPDDINTTLARQTNEIDLIADRILKRARLAGQSHAGEYFDFAKDLPDLLETLRLMYSDKAITPQLEMPDAIHYPIERQDMMELLGNLLDNAWKWAHQTVHIRIRMNDKLTICIEDDGPGVDASRLAQLTRRGARLDESIQGHGFGLAIVADMVEEYKGELSFGRSETLGGLKVDVTL